MEIAILSDSTYYFVLEVDKKISGKFVHQSRCAGSTIDIGVAERGILHFGRLVAGKSR